MYSSNPPGPISQHLKIWFFDFTTNATQYIRTQSYFIGGTISDEEGNTRPLTKDEYKISVTISSNPELREGVYKYDYLLTVDGFISNSDL